MKEKKGRANDNVKKSLKVISLFTGAGGLDLGFEQAGYETIYANDFDSKCCETLRLNIGKSLCSNMKVVEGDIREINLKELPQADIVIGGPPCQTFSASGRRAGGAPGRLDDRGTLFEAYFNVIERVKPKAFLFENVRGILGTNKGEDWRIIVSKFEKFGYKTDFRILDALDYGAPQQRERMIMVGHKLDKPFLFPEPIFGLDSSTGLPHIAAQEALEDLEDSEDLSPLYLDGGKYGHLLKLVPPGENYLFFTEKRGYPTPIFAYRSRFSDFLYKANPLKPIKTLIASPGKYTGPFHWDNRRFTVAEYKRLQGFPDDYIFAGNRNDKIKQIGNSVSPKMSHHLALAIAKQVFAKDIEIHLMPKDRSLSFDKRKGEKAKLTRERHVKVLEQREKSPNHIFSLKSYKTQTGPSMIDKVNTAISVKKGNEVKIILHTDDSESLFAAMSIKIRPNGLNNSSSEVVLNVNAYGISEFTIQAMWNAVDNWVKESSNFSSLFELYGHFTEPHPIFQIVKFETFSDHPIAEFSKHCSNFLNCSTYFPRKHLTQIFNRPYNSKNFVALVEMLRGYRFDIRCIETNLAMPKDMYMICYPFALPHSKQMNFKVKPLLKNLPQKKEANILEKSN